MADVIQVQKTGQIGTDNDPDWPQMTYGGNPPRRKTDGGRIVLDWRAVLAVAAALLIVGVPLWAWYTWGYCARYDDPCRSHGDVLWFAVRLFGLTVAALWVLKQGGLWGAQVNAARADALQLTVRPDAFGEPIPLALLHQEGAQELLMTRYMARLALEEAIAPHKRYSGVETLNEGAQSTVSTNLGAPPALPAPVEASGLAAERDWLDWIDRTPHLIIAGRTEAGKTTHACAILAERAQRGEQIAVLDPHYQPGKWLGLPTIGAGRDFPAILAALEALLREMDARYQEYSAGKKTEEFERLTILVDEAPAIYNYSVEQIGTRRKVLDNRWFDFSKSLGSEARKVRMSVILLTQSAQVQNLGINTGMLDNFTRLALGDTARELVDEESLKDQRATLIELLRDRAFPAAMEYRNRYYVLDNAGVPALAARSGAQARPWVPQLVSTPPQPPQDRAAVLGILRKARAAGWTREQARVRLGVAFTNDLWTAAGE